MGKGLHIHIPIPTQVVSKRRTGVLVPPSNPSAKCSVSQEPVSPSRSRTQPRLPRALAPNQRLPSPVPNLPPPHRRRAEPLCRSAPPYRARARPPHRLRSAPRGAFLPRPATGPTPLIRPRPRQSPALVEGRRRERRRLLRRPPSAVVGGRGDPRRGGADAAGQELVGCRLADELNLHREAILEKGIVPSCGKRGRRRRSSPVEAGTSEESSAARSDLRPPQLR